MPMPPVSQKLTRDSENLFNDTHLSLRVLLLQSDVTFVEETHFRGLATHTGLLHIDLL